MNCLVTGASGFIGGSLVNRLVKEKHNVRALIHTSKSKEVIKKVEYFNGDITNIDTLFDAVKNIDVVFHCAAYVKDYGPKKNFYKINYEGTKNIVKACEKEKILRFIFLSHIIYETKSNSYYSKTKELAENYLINKYKSDKFPVVIIRPGNVYGPGATTWVLRPINAIMKNRIALINGGIGIFHHTFVDNLLDAMMLSMKEPKALGEVIDVTDGTNDTKWRDYLNSLSEFVVKKEINRNFSISNMIVLSKIMMFGYKLFKIEPWITPEAIEIFTNNSKISIDKAKNILGYKPKIDYKKGMIKVKKWLKEEGYVS